MSLLPRRAVTLETPTSGRQRVLATEGVTLSTGSPPPPPPARSPPALPAASPRLFRPSPAESPPSVELSVPPVVGRLLVVPELLLLELLPSSAAARSLARWRALRSLAAW